MFVASIPASRGGPPSTDPEMTTACVPDPDQPQIDVAPGIAGTGAPDTQDAGMTKVLKVDHPLRRLRAPRRWKIA